MARSLFLSVSFPVSFPQALFAHAFYQRAAVERPVALPGVKLRRCGVDKGVARFANVGGCGGPAHFANRRGRPAYFANGCGRPAHFANGLRGFALLANRRGGSAYFASGFKAPAAIASAVLERLIFHLNKAPFSQMPGNGLFYRMRYFAKGTGTSKTIRRRRAACTRDALPHNVDSAGPQSARRVRSEAARYGSRIRLRLARAASV